MRVWTGICLALSGFWIAQPACAQFERDWAERFKIEAPHDWSRCVEILRNRRLQVESSRFDLANGRVLRDHTWYEYRSLGPLFSETAQELGPKQESGTCSVRSTQYAFDLKRRDQNQQWALTQFHTEKLPARFGAAPNGRRAGPLWLQDQWLPDWYSQPGFKVTSAVSENRDNKGLCRIEFSWKPTNRVQGPINQGETFIKEGWIVFDPAHSWCVDSFEAKAAWTSCPNVIIRGRYDRTEHFEEKPTKYRYTDETSGTLNDGTNVHRELMADFQFLGDSATEDNFTLSAFGFPEPAGAGSPKPIPRYLWLLSSAFLLLASRAIIRFFFRRRQTHQAA
jgi:hypothetical protein